MPAAWASRPPGSLRPGDDGYDRARCVWNGMIDRRPALIVPCCAPPDVAAGLRYARAAGLPVTVRGGGHNVAGAAVADDAVMLDLSPMRKVTVDRAARVAHAGGGARLGDLDARTTPLGLACPTGVVPETGLGGLALGGGYGWLARAWGLTCDHIVAARVVLADGRVVDASERHDSELLWGLRGGGGNFGVVTRFTLALRPVREAWLRCWLLPLDRAGEALAAYRALAPEQPDDLQVVAALERATAAADVPADLRGRPVLAMTAAWVGGDPARAQRICDAALGRIDAPVVRTWRLPYAALQARGAGTEPAGRRYYTSSSYLRELSDPAIARLVDAAASCPSPTSVIDLGYLMGAIARVAEDGTAFPRRGAPYICSASAAWDDPAADEDNVAWARGLTRELEEWQFGGSYVNYTAVRAGSARSIYGPVHYDRLTALKDRVDPTNAFRANHNIAPSPARSGVTP
ncbi:MAG: FAD-binding oxidoreductase [Frankiaceae bacterium]